MDAMGYKPVKDEGLIVTYESPFRADKEASFWINTEKNTWRDDKLGDGGNIYMLAAYITGSCHTSDLTHFIASEMSAKIKINIRHEPDPPKPKRGMRL